MMNTKSRWRWLNVLGLALGLWAAAAAAEPTWEQAAQRLRAAALPAAQAEALLAQAKARQVPTAQFAAWAENMARLHQAGVPATLMAERIQQGLVKDVPAERIGQALTALQENLLWARQAVDRHVAKAEIHGKPAQVEEACRNIEASLRAGVERAQLTQILGKNPLTLDQLAALARVAANLRAWGVEASGMVRLLTQTANAGMGAKELASLEGRFAAGMAAGRPASSLFAEFERGVKDFQSRDAGMRDEFQREIREEMRREQMQDFKKPPMDVPSGAPGGPGGGPGY